MKRQLRDRIEQLEVVAANRYRRRQNDQDEMLQAIREVALAGFPVFRENLIAFSKVRSAQATEDFAGIGIRFHEEGHPGRDFRHEVQALLTELGVIDPVEFPLCYCPQCFAKFSAAHRPR